MQQSDQYKVAKGWPYTDFVRRNPTGARTIENLLQYAGFFIPNRIANREVAIESGYAIASVLAVVHDRILFSRGKERLSGYQSSRGSDDTKATGDGKTPNSEDRRKSSMEAFSEEVRLVLSMLINVQIVIEKIAGQHGGLKRRRQAITCVEALKVLARLVLVATTREMLIDGGQYVRGGSKSTRGRRERAITKGERRARGQTSIGRDRECILDSADSVPETLRAYTGKRSGVRLAIPGGPRFGRGTRRICSEAHGYRSSVYDGEGGARSRGYPNGGEPIEMNGFEPLGIRQEIHGTRENDEGGDSDNNLDSGDAEDDEDERGRGGGGGGGLSRAWLLAGEVIHILRPLVYSQGCAYAGERSWRPWLISLGMDAVAFACTIRAGQGTNALLLPLGDDDGPNSSRSLVLPYLSDEQALELRRRKLLWLMYLMRSPAFELLTEPVSRGAAGLFEGVPLFNGMARYALAMLLYVQRHHFYISAS